MKVNIKVVRDSLHSYTPDVTLSVDEEEGTVTLTIQEPTNDYDIYERKITINKRDFVRAIRILSEDN